MDALAVPAELPFLTLKRWGNNWAATPLQSHGPGADAVEGRLRQWQR
jgi:hypothetical protein